MRLSWSILGVLGGCADYRDCGDADVDGVTRLPESLSDAGLYVDGVRSRDAVPFEPRFPLWSDGVDKRRWLLLPMGTTIETIDPTNWSFPVGTRLFKEFSLDGARLETRMSTRLDSGWVAVAYRWDAAERDAVRVPDGVVDVGGTPHDVPSAGECVACHGGREAFVLGVSAVQLSTATREDWYAAGWLSDPPSGELALRSESADGLGVLHANCSHCHNAERQNLDVPCYTPWQDFDLTLPHDVRALDATPAVQTASRMLGELGDSRVIDRMSVRGDTARRFMPPLASERVDAEGVAAVERLLESMEP